MAHLHEPAVEIDSQASAYSAASTIAANKVLTVNLMLLSRRGIGKNTYNFSSSLDEAFKLQSPSCVDVLIGNDLRLQPCFENGL